MVVGIFVRVWKRIRDKYAAGKLTFMRSVGIAVMTGRGYITYIQELKTKNLLITSESGDILLLNKKLKT